MSGGRKDIYVIKLKKKKKKKKIKKKNYFNV
jgi:hypothetical protein